MKAVLTIKEAMVARGLSQKALAALTGIRESTISSICRGTGTSINLDFLQRIAEVLEVTDIRELISLQ